MNRADILEHHECVTLKGFNMPSKRTKQIEVNASVARAAGGEDATYSTSINCTNFLETFEHNTSNKIVMTLELAEEWDEHQSKYATTWLTRMIATKRFHYINLPNNDLIYEKIEATATHDKEVNAMLKDFHLLRAALATDMIVISLDETIRLLFAKASHNVGEIQNIIWVNPDRTIEEQPVIWLKNGAPPEAHRQLSAYQPTK